MVTREKFAVFHCFFPHVLEVAQSDYTRRDSTALGVIRTLSRVDRILINLPMAEARDFHCYSHVFENLGKRTIPSDHAAVRFVIQNPTNRGHQSMRCQRWMSKHPVFCFLQQLHDDHRFSLDPFGALAAFKVSYTKPRGSRFVNSHGRHLAVSERSSQSLPLLCVLIEIDILGHSCDVVKAWKPVEDCFNAMFF